MTTRLALLPSPLLGPAVWAAVGSALADRGWTVTSPPVFGPLRSPADRLAHWENALPEDAAYVLVPHSNAGLYVPALGERPHVLGTVFVDAALPPGSGSAPLRPLRLYEMLAGLADGNGMLPPWTGWWDDAELADVFPDIGTRAGVEAEQIRLPCPTSLNGCPWPPVGRSVPTPTSLSRTRIRRNGRLQPGLAGEEPPGRPPPDPHGTGGRRNCARCAPCARCG
ncbi:MAG: hypothetical protein JWR57_1488 [Mycetocola sp.]|nr:hypothetical protein [Mycetocola sp.]